jgi:hypothetical protein
MGRNGPAAIGYGTLNLGQGSAQHGVARILSSETMEEIEVPIEAIKAEIRESIDRAKAMVVESEQFVRDHSQPAPKVRAEAA